MMTIKWRRFKAILGSLVMLLVAFLQIGSTLVATHYSFQKPVRVGQWDRFEQSIPNAKTYPYPYRDVSLAVTYTRPDGSKVQFWGYQRKGATTTDGQTLTAPDDKDWLVYLVKVGKE